MTATSLPPRTQDLSEGPLGIALLDIESGDLPAARRHIAQAVVHGVSAGANASLFHGAPALEFVLARAGHAGRDVRDVVDRVVDARLTAARRRQESGVLPNLAEWDLIRGLTGLGALLLTRGAPSARLTDVLSYLVSRPGRSVSKAGTCRGGGQRSGPQARKCPTATATTVWPTESPAP
ncbi:hypothetical protein ACFQ0X_22140 [Streptomyces rectiviolaceus]|uniref:hypothetical protein n=1 Tax=Streptomyces rectiviolaceus TaxID=332591 RepID=UPI00364590BD